MRSAQKILDMMAEFLSGSYDPLDFSYDYPQVLADERMVLDNENPALSNFLDGDLQYVCGCYDPYDTGDPDTIDLNQFKAKVREVYDAAAQLTDAHRQAI